MGWSCTEKAAADEARAKSHHTRHRLEQELAELRNRYRTLTAAVFDTDAVKDSGDQAQRLELADDLARLSDRIHQIIEVLTGRVPPSPTDALPDGTQVVIRFGDGSTDTIQVATIPGDTVTRNSPLGRALTGAHPGDRITYPGPDGMINAQTPWGPGPCGSDGRSGRCAPAEGGDDESSDTSALFTLLR